MAAPAPQMDVATCERLLNVASSAPKCPTPTMAPVPQTPEWDALANSFASLSTAFTWGTILLALVAILAAAGWGYLVRVWAQAEARKEAADCAQREIEKWLRDQAPQLVRKHVELLQNASLDPTSDDDAAADEMGEEAG